jgi:putative acetyltransferase
VNSKDYTAQEVEYACTKFSPDYFRDKIESRVFYKATLDNKIVGQASYGEGKIHTLFVHPEFQGQRIGVTLLAKLEITAFDAKAFDILLSSSVVAKGFYEKFGYSLLNTENSQAGITYLMKKQLTPR